LAEQQLNQKQSSEKAGSASPMIISSSPNHWSKKEEIKMKKLSSEGDQEKRRYEETVQNLKFENEKLNNGNQAQLKQFEDLKNELQPLEKVFFFSIFIIFLFLF
jgi:predicted RNase H-like nuclease (RuvC/YqgF family)